MDSRPEGSAARRPPLLLRPLECTADPSNPAAMRSTEKSWSDNRAHSSKLDLRSTQSPSADRHDEESESSSLPGRSTATHSGEYSRPAYESCKQSAHRPPKRRS